jgi:hypothetical protein
MSCKPEGLEETCKTLNKLKVIKEWGILNNIVSEIGNPKNNRPVFSWVAETSRDTYNRWNAQQSKKLDDVVGIFEQNVSSGVKNTSRQDTRNSTHEKPGTRRSALRKLKIQDDSEDSGDSEDDEATVKPEVALNVDRVLSELRRLRENQESFNTVFWFF